MNYTINGHDGLYTVTWENGVQATFKVLGDLVRISATNGYDEITDLEGFDGDLTAESIQAWLDEDVSY